jgi:hypothetical protein
MSVASHYRKKLEKEDLKRLCKEVCQLFLAILTIRLTCI